MSSKQTLSVTFKSTCDVSAVDCGISIEHDDALNGGVSEFAVGSQIFYRVFPSGDYAYFLSNGGTVSVITSYKVEEITEEITFDGSKNANLSQPLDSEFTYAWIGNTLGTTKPHSKIIPQVIGEAGSTRLAANEAVYGILTATYKYSYTSVKFLPLHAGKQLLLACRTCDEAENCTSIIEDILDEFFDDVTLRIKDACENDLKVPGAQVEVNGELVDGVTDENGEIHVGLLPKGVHAIKVTAPGYEDSDADFLSNDEIIVE